MKDEKKTNDKNKTCQGIYTAHYLAQVADNGYNQKTIKELRKIQ